MLRASLFNLVRGLLKEPPRDEVTNMVRDEVGTKLDEVVI